VLQTSIAFRRKNPGHYWKMVELKIPENREKLEGMRGPDWLGASEQKERPRLWLERQGQQAATAS
jgi:hypothetical protein